MDPSLAAALAVLSLLSLLGARVPVFLCLLASGSLGLWLIDGMHVLQAALGRLPYSTVASFTLIVIPMFVAMGVFAKNANIAEHAFSAATKLLGWLPGGLALSALAACALFAAVSGSSAATVVTVGRVSMDEMRRHGYRDTFSAGVVGVAGTLGILIPPSLVLVLYGIVTGESIGQLLLAGVIPGLFSAAMYGVFIVARALRTPELVGRPPRQPAMNQASARNEPGGTALGSAGQHTTATAHAAPVGFSLRLTAVEWWGVFQVALLFGAVMGGIYLGWYTSTESAAVGALLAFLFLLFRIGTDKVRLNASAWRSMRASLRETAELTAMVFGLLIGGAVFSLFLTSARIPQDLTTWITSQGLPDIGILLLVILMFLILGMFIDSLSMLLIAVPIAYPVITELGYDGVWFAILVVKTMEIGLITPPVGINAFVLAGTVKGLTVERAFKGVLGFLPADLVTLALLIAFPAISLWLPGQAGS